MKKQGKLLLAVVTIWPFFYMILFFAFFVSSFFFVSSNGSSEGGALPPLFVLILPLHLLTMLVIMGLTVFYMVNVFKNGRVEKDKKVLWAVVLFMGNVISMPIYWYLYIWRDMKEPSGTVSPREISPPVETRDHIRARSRTADEQYVPPSQPPNWRG